MSLEKSLKEHNLLVLKHKIPQSRTVQLDTDHLIRTKHLTKDKLITSQTFNRIFNLVIKRGMMKHGA